MLVMEFMDESVTHVPEKFSLSFHFMLPFIDIACAIQFLHFVNYTDMKLQVLKFLTLERHKQWTLIVIAVYFATKKLFTTARLRTMPSVCVFLGFV